MSPIYIVPSDVPFDIILPAGTTRIPLLQRNAAGRVFRTGSELNGFLRHLNTAGAQLPLVRDDLELGDGFTSFDLRLSKTFRVSERWSVQGIVEVFNLFNVTNIRGVNNVNFSGFQNTLIRDSEISGTPGFLRATSFGAPLQTAGGVFGTGGPRAFQLAAKITF